MSTGEFWEVHEGDVTARGSGKPWKSTSSIYPARRRAPWWLWPVVFLLLAGFGLLATGLAERVAMAEREHAAQRQNVERVMR